MKLAILGATGQTGEMKKIVTKQKPQKLSQHMSTRTPSEWAIQQKSCL